VSSFQRPPVGGATGPRATFLVGVVLGSVLTVGVLVAASMASREPAGTGMVAAMAAVGVLVLSVLVVVLNVLGEQKPHRGG